MVVAAEGSTSEPAIAAVALGLPPAVERAIGDALTTRYATTRRLAAVAADGDIEPDDVVHEVFARVFARWRTTGLPDDPDAYLRRAVMNHLRNERRTRARGRAAATRIAASVASAEDHPGYPSDLDALLEALAPEDRSLVFLVDVEGLSARDAADAVGLSAVAARSRLSRARRRLRAAIVADDRGDLR